MNTPLLTLYTYLQTRAERDERGSGTTDWMMLSILAVVVVGAIIIAMNGVGTAVVDKIKGALGV